MYAEAARRSHFETERWWTANRGYVEERSVLGTADHCDGCLSEAGKGWRPIGTLSPIGGRDCKARCRCWFEYRRPGEIAAGRAIDFPRDHTQATTHELEDALEDVLAGRPVAVPLTNPIGCNVKWEGMDAGWMPPEPCDLVPW